MSPLTPSRDGSRDRSESRLVKHSHTMSESGRSSVPMWDSSDPDRAPPPLPLNPSMGSPVTRSNTSARIEEAAALIQARARENAPSTYTSNPPPAPSSPEKSPTRAQHRRMQTLQGSGTTGRLSDSLERRSLDKGLRSSKLLDFDDFRASRSGSAQPEADTPAPTGRNLKQTENTRPSVSNILALQPVHSKQEPASPLATITNISNGSTISTTPTMDSLASQILNITSIATNLQREMANLSQRSKDNATDLMDLRKATNNRDEDIRKSLRELVAGLEKRSEPQHRLLGGPETARPVSSLNSYMDESSHETPRKTYTISRITSPSLDREISASPSLAYADGAASIALLEKVLREMATKEGQANIRETLEAVRSQVLDQSQMPLPPSGEQAATAVDPVMLAKLDEILNFMHQLQDEAATKAIVRRADGGERSISQTGLSHDRELNGPLARNDQSPTPTPMSGSELSTDEFLKLLKNVKQTVVQGGGLTNEVKALVRELRGEVLGMGREIAKKLEDVQSSARSLDDTEQAVGRDEIAAIVGNALGELKEHMHHTVQKAQLQSPAPYPQSDVDTVVVVQAVTSAIANMPALQKESSRSLADEREDLIRSIREAWEDCKPEIALQHFGLERDEILEALKEGLKSHQPSQPTIENAGATYEEVLEAVRKGLADFRPSSPAEKQEIVSKEEVLSAVREVLENFDWPALSTLSSNPATESELSGMTRGDISDIVHEAITKHSPPVPQHASIPELSRREIINAVEEGMARQPPVTKEVEFNREDLFDAIKSCLEGEQNPLGGMGERVVEAMHEFLASMKTEFQEYSTANGKDTEQVLDALKDGLEDLRADIESYVDRASDVTGKDEIIELVKDGFAGMRMDIDKVAARPAPSATNTPELLDAMEKEFEHLRDSISKSMTLSQPRGGNEEILDAIRDLQDDRQSSLSSNSEDIVRLVKEELAHMRATLAGTLVKSGAALQREDVADAVREAMESSRDMPKPEGSESILSNTSELLDAFQDGVDNIRTDLQKLMNRPTDVSTTYEVLDTLKAGIEDVRNDISNLQKSYQETADRSSVGEGAVVVHDENKIHAELESLKVMITQLRIKIEALEDMPAPIVDFPREMRVHKDDLDELHTAIQGVHSTLQGVHSSVRDVKNAPAPEVVIPSNMASKEDTDAIETLLTNMKAKIDDMAAPDAASSFGSTVRAEQLEAMELLLREVRVAVDDLGEKSSESGKVDLELVEFMLKDVLKAVEEIQGRMAAISPEGELLTKSEIGVVESLCADIKTRVDDLCLPDPASLPTKEDVKEVKDSLQAFREQLEADNDLTAQAFEARKIEHGGLATKIDDVKGIIGDLRDELITKLDGSEEGIIELNKVLGMHHDGMSAFATASSIADLSDYVKSEFQKQADSQTSRKIDLEENSATLFNKHEETSAELKAALEDKFNELMIKYDDAQASNARKLSGLDENAKSHVETMESTRAAVDEMKAVVEGLGSTVTEACEGISADSKTVFSKVDEASAKLEELHTISALEHQQTREEVVKAGAAASRLEGILAENHPSVLAAIHEVLDAVSEHKAHSQEQTENLARAAEEIKSNVGALPSSITGLLPAPTAVTEQVREVPVAPAYDDSEVHDKLDNLLRHATRAKEVFADIENHHKSTQESLGNLEKLDQIHGAVMAAAAEVSSMVETQARLMTEAHDAKREEAIEAAIALEKRVTQKETVEADIVRLGEEKNALVESMQALRLEHEDLSNQTKALSRQVAQLEATLSTRHKEMREMNDRAETLERRILEGLMNQARRSKEAKKVPSSRKRVSPQERDASMSLKRVPSSASTATATTTKTSVRDGGSKKRPSLGLGHSKSGSSRQSAVDRRILSTSHVTGNRARDTLERQLVLAAAPTASTGLVSLKRSHSVKGTPSGYGELMKPSWNKNSNAIKGKQQQQQQQLVPEDKENMSYDGERADDDCVSDSHADESFAEERRSSVSRTSMGTSYMYTDSSLGYDTGTGSIVSTNSARTVSYNSSIGGTLNGGPESVIMEEEENEGQQDGEEFTLSQHPRPPAKKISVNDIALTHQNSQETVIQTTSKNYSGPVLDQQSVSRFSGVAGEGDDDEHSQFVTPGAAVNEKKPGPRQHYHASDSGLGSESAATAATEEDYFMHGGHGHGHGEAESYYNMGTENDVSAST